MKSARKRYVALGSSMAASLPRCARRLPLLAGWIAELLDRDTRDRALAEAFDSLCAIGGVL